MSKVIIIKKFIDGTRKHLSHISRNSGIILIESLNKYQLARRLMLVFIMYMTYDMYIVTKTMYKLTNTVDTQWVIYTTAWTAMLTIFITFYTTSRVKEIDNAHRRNLQQQWIDKNNNGINDLEEGYVEEEFNTEECDNNDITKDFKNID